MCVIFLQQQDHYKVLGLGKLRHKATAGDIKKACNYTFDYNYGDVNLCMDCVFSVPQPLLCKWLSVLLGQSQPFPEKSLHFVLVTCVASTFGDYYRVFVVSAV